MVAGSRTYPGIGSDRLFSTPPSPLPPAPRPSSPIKTLKQNNTTPSFLRSCSQQFDNESFVVLTLRRPVQTSHVSRWCTGTDLPVLTQELRFYDSKVGFCCLCLCLLVLFVCYRCCCCCVVFASLSLCLCLPIPLPLKTSAFFITRNTSESQMTAVNFIV